VDRARGGWWSPILVVLTVAAVVTSTVAVWTRTTVLDTDRFMAVVGPALSDPSFTAALSDVVAREVLVALDLDARVAATLEEVDTFLAGAALEATDPDSATLDRLSRSDRPTLAALAPAITAALETRVAEKVDGLLTSEAFTRRLPELVRQAHEGGAALVRGELAQLPGVEVRAGEVRLDLRPVIVQALREVLVELHTVVPDVTIPPALDGLSDTGSERLATALGTRLPPGFGQLTIMRRTDLTQLQATVRMLDRLVDALVLLTIALLAVTVLTARNRRRTVVQLAGGLVLGLGAAALLVRYLERIVLEAITHPDGTQAAGVLLGELTDSLRSVALIIAAGALAAGVAAHLFGRRLWSAGLPSRGRRPAAAEDHTTDREPPRSSTDRGHPVSR
jgi:hypothetical protein